MKLRISSKRIFIMGLGLLLTAAGALIDDIDLEMRINEIIDEREQEENK